MNALFKLNHNNYIKNASLILESFNKSILFKAKICKQNIQNQNYISTGSIFNKKLTLFDPSLQQSTRTVYTFNLSNRLVKYRRATRPKKSNDNSILLNYEQAQFAENLGLTKNWNIWNTSNLLDGKRQAETVRDDILIRRFLLGTFHDLFASEILIKRRFNTINIGFLIKIPKNSKTEAQKIYFLVGYSEQLLSFLLKSVVKIQVQSIFNKNDLIFKRW